LFIEQYMKDIVLPFYANSHTEASATGLQTLHFHEQARDYIHQALNAPQEEYTVLFTGSGATGAIDKLSHVPHNWWQR
jgi:selenocysteine lyase/cysteine desulfurase